MCSNIIYVKESFVRLVIPCFSKKDWSCQDEILSIHNPTNDRFCPKKKANNYFLYMWVSDNSTSKVFDRFCNLVISFGIITTFKLNFYYIIYNIKFLFSKNLCQDL